MWPCSWPQQTGPARSSEALRNPESFAITHRWLGGTDWDGQERAAHYLPLPKLGVVGQSCQAGWGPYREEGATSWSEYQLWLFCPVHQLPHKYFIHNATLSISQAHLIPNMKSVSSEMSRTSVMCQTKQHAIVWKLSRNTWKMQWEKTPADENSGNQPEVKSIKLYHFLP